MPDVPAIAELVLPGFESTNWFGLMAPAHTPPEVIKKVYRDIVSILNEPELKARFLKIGLETVGDSPDMFAV